MISRGLGQASAETAAWLSLVAYVRHALTEYDDLLAQGYDQESARFFVAAAIDAVLNGGEYGASSPPSIDLSWAASSAIRRETSRGHGAHSPRRRA